MNKDQKKLIAKLIQRNEASYNLFKLGEECQELGLAITQYRMKPEKVDYQKIIDEIGDVEIRIKMIKEAYKQIDPTYLKLVNDRVNFKLGKYQEYLNEDKYKNI